MDFLSKADLMAMYGCSHPKQFANQIGVKGQKVLEWKPGHQRFTPKQVRKLYNTIGRPLRKDEKYA